MTLGQLEVVCLGEALIDLVSTATGVSVEDAPAFKKAAGGAPANVAVGLARLGVRAAFMGKVGDDQFGHFLARVLAESGVDVGSLVFSSQARTALAFVSLAAGGEREFMFYRHPSADMLLEETEIDVDAIRSARILHFGSIALSSEPARSATLRAVKLATDAGLLVSYDPNLRLSLWPSQEAARDGILTGWQHANVIKLSREELGVLTDNDSMSDAVKALWHKNLRLMVVTDGPRGCHFFATKDIGQVPGFEVEAIDATGAGDGFAAGLLCHLARDRTILEDRGALYAALRYANAVGALTTTRLGAIPALPTPEEVETLLARNRCRRT